MEKQNFFHHKKYVLAALAGLLVLSLAILPFVLGSAKDPGEHEASILSGTVGRNTIRSTVSGAGTLTEDEAAAIALPDGVRLKTYLVANGQKVREGEALAEVDRVSVMESISTVQDNLAYLEEEMNAVSSEWAGSSLCSAVTGTVKAVYAEKGDAVQDVMLSHGALAVISLDGLMAVELESSEKLSAGETVTVLFADGSEKTGMVKTVMDGRIAVTLPDEGYAIGETVQIKDGGGKQLGSGELILNSPWKATGFLGTVSGVYIEEGDTVSTNSMLFSLQDTEYTAERELLARKHREYEELMFTLFRMYQDEQIVSPVDGEVSGISKETVELLSASRGGFLASLLANAPDGNNEVFYSNYVGMVMADGTVRMNPEAQAVEDYTVLSAVNTDVDRMTVESAFPVGTVYVFDGAAWATMGSSPGDVLLFAADAEGQYVWAVYVTSGQLPTEPEEPENPETPEAPGDPETPGEGKEEDGEMPGQSDGQRPEEDGFTGSYAMGGMALPEEEFEFYPLNGTVLMSVTPLETMHITLSMDELDILSLAEGQKAEIGMDAFPGQCFEGTVTVIGLSGENRKYAVELSLPRGEGMVAGMNASVTITVDTAENVISIPEEALVDQGSKTYVYTGYDKGEGTLISLVEVNTGVSDGLFVEVDLPEGSSYWYAYYDTPPVHLPF